jgi:hypothetical protein
MSAAREHWSDIMSGRQLVTHELHTPTVVPALFHLSMLLLFSPALTHLVLLGPSSMAARSAMILSLRPVPPLARMF